MMIEALGIDLEGIDQPDRFDVRVKPDGEYRLICRQAGGDFVVNLTEEVVRHAMDLQLDPDARDQCKILLARLGSGQ
jgi:hypothetical protein